MTLFEIVVLCITGGIIVFTIVDRICRCIEQKYISTAYQTMKETEHAVSRN